MKFDELNQKIPYAMGGEIHVLQMKPYPSVTIAMPGRHQSETFPMGGDFVVMVDDKFLDWDKHPFTHVDIFKDIQYKHDQNHDLAKSLMKAYGEVIHGRDPEDFRHTFEKSEYAEIFEGSMVPLTFLRATQALAVAEHRRYAKHESRGGGRFLPFRFALGISEGLWTAKDCASQQKRGRPGLDYLIRENGDLTPLTEWEGPW